jgi:pseudouridine-5'-phosphate glycosidase
MSGQMSGLIDVRDEVRDALDRGSGVVALETSVIGQGLPHPRNLECADRMSAAIRRSGALPAWIGVLDGAVRIGLTGDELARFAEPAAAEKLARRDVPLAITRGTLGAATVSATIWAASIAGIRIGATGGIGGVHPGTWPGSWPDVSADLLELARTPGMLVCSGAKSIVDTIATAEKLDELGVALIGYRVDQLASFFVHEAPVELEHRADTAEEAASMLRTALELDTRSTLLLCNPIPQAEAMDPHDVEQATAEAERRMDDADVRGKARTPMLLAAIAEITEGRSVQANLALLVDNARLAGEVAAAAGSLPGLT